MSSIGRAGTTYFTAVRWWFWWSHLCVFNVLIGVSNSISSFCNYYIINRSCKRSVFMCRRHIWQKIRAFSWFFRVKIKHKFCSLMILQRRVVVFAKKYLCLFFKINRNFIGLLRQFTLQFPRVSAAVAMVIITCTFYLILSYLHLLKPEQLVIKAFVFRISCILL